jgi:hypothetical protein
MKKNDITIGGVYVCKVSGKLVPVRIVQASPTGGWQAVNVATGREVRVKTAARLRRPAVKPLTVGTRVAVDIGQGLDVVQGTIAEAEYDTGQWLYRIDTPGGNECPDHRNKDGELWVWHSEVKPLPV